MTMNFKSDNVKVRICGNLAMEGSGSAASKSLHFISNKFNVNCGPDFFSQLKKVIRCPLVDHNENVTASLVCDTLCLRDYGDPYFTYQECNDILQFICCE